MPTALKVEQIEEGPTVLGDEIMSVERRRSVSPAVLRTFVAIADLWALNEEQRRKILGFPPRSTYHNWVTRAREHQSLTLDFDVLIRISLILGIYKNLRILHATEHDGVEWLRLPNRTPLFNGQTPLDLIASGHQDALWATRRFLDGARGGLFMPPNEVDKNFKKYTDSDLVWS